MTATAIDNEQAPDKVHLELFCKLCHRLPAEARCAGHPELVLQLTRFVGRYLDREQVLPRTPQELFEAQVLLRRLLLSTRCYELVYAFYMRFKYPHGIDQDWFVEHVYRPHVEHHRWKLQWIAGYDTVLEVGCGAASMGLALAQLNGRWLATDVCRDESLDRMIAEYRPGPEFTFQLIEGTGLAEIADESVDAVVSGDFFEHLLEDDAVTHLANACRVLRPGGVVIIKTPAGVGGPSDITQFLPEYDQPQGLHIKEYRVREMQQLLTEAGFGCIRHRILRFHAVYSMPQWVQRWNFMPPAVAAGLESLGRLTWLPVRRSKRGRRLWHRFWGRFGVPGMLVVARKGLTGGTSSVDSMTNQPPRAQDAGADRHTVSL